MNIDVIDSEFFHCRVVCSVGNKQETVRDGSCWINTRNKRAELTLRASALLQ
jgi:hypothetical protein